jgi:hypothetical protein
VTSCRQYSFGLADAGVAIATNASVNNAAASALVIFKSCFILAFLSASSPKSTWDGGDLRAIGAEK